MPSHCRSGLGLGPINLHHGHQIGPFSFNKAGAMMHQNAFDIHRAYQVDSCTSTFHPGAVKDDPSPGVPRSNSVLHNHPAAASSSRSAAVEEVDVETILQLNELQDWAWPTVPVDHHLHHVATHEAKPINILSELNSLPFSSSQSMQAQLAMQHEHEQKGSSNSFFGETVPSHVQQQQSFDLQSWCNGARSIMPPMPRLLCDSNGAPQMRFPASAEPSPTTDTSPLRLDSRDLKCSPVTTPLSHARSSYPGGCSKSEAIKAPGERGLGVQKTWQGKRAVTQRESHIWSERQRRKGMNHLFSTLRSLLPQPTSKTDKSTVVSEIIKYIQGLQVKLDELSKKRAELLHRKQAMDMTTRRVNLRSPPSMGNSNLVAGAGMSSSVSNESCLQSFVMPNVALHISGNNAFITMSSVKKKGIFSRILLIMQGHKLDIINAHISTTPTTVFHCLHVLAPKTSGDFPKEALQTALQSLTLPE